MNRIKTAVLKTLTRLTRLCVRQWCSHPQTRSVEAYVVYVTTWMNMETKEQGAYSEVSGKFVCIHCGKVLLGRYPCLTVHRDEGEEGEDLEDDGDDEDPNAEGVQA
jgi:hypothetical protein